MDTHVSQPARIMTGHHSPGLPRVPSRVPPGYPWGITGVPPGVPWGSPLGYPQGIPRCTPGVPGPPRTPRGSPAGPVPPGAHAPGLTPGVPMRWLLPRARIGCTNMIATPDAPPKICSVLTPRLGPPEGGARTRRFPSIVLERPGGHRRSGRSRGVPKIRFSFNRPQNPHNRLNCAKSI